MIRIFPILFALFWILSVITSGLAIYALVQVNNSYPNGYTGYLLFPADSINIGYGPPTRPLCILAISRFWNILKYFNPNSAGIDTGWDTILLHHILDFDTAINPLYYYKYFLKVAGALDDDHTEAWTFNGDLSYLFPGYNMPKISLVYADSSYVISKSELAGINPGDVLDSINGLSMSQWEDSLRPYISAGNPAVFRLSMCQRSLLRGSVSFSIAYSDSTGAIMHQNVLCNSNT